MNKNKLKFFDELKTSENLKKEIIKKTINKNSEVTKRKKINKFAYACTFIIILSFISSGVVFAVKYIQSTNIQKLVNDLGYTEHRLFIENYVKVNDVENFTCNKGCTFKYLEETLGINIFSNENYNSVIDECSFSINAEGTLEYLSTYIYDYVSYEEENFDLDSDDFFNSKQLSLETIFVTESASEDLINSLSINVSVSNEDGVEEVYLEDLGLLVYTFGFRDPNPTKFWISYVAFTYNDIVYLYHGRNLTTKEIIELIK